MFTNKEIKEMFHKPLIEKFKGLKTSYSCYGITNTVKEVLTEVIKGTKYNIEDFEIRNPYNKHWVVEIIYKKWSTVIEIRAKRQVSKKSYWGNDYSYKDFEIDIFGWDKDFYGQLDEIDVSVERRMNSEAEQDRKAYEVLTYVMEKFALKDYQARDLLKRAVDRYYTLLGK